MAKLSQLRIRPLTNSASSPTQLRALQHSRVSDIALSNKNIRSYSSRASTSCLTPVPPFSHVELRVLNFGLAWEKFESCQEVRKKIFVYSISICLQTSATAHPRCEALPPPEGFSVNFTRGSESVRYLRVFSLVDSGYGALLDVSSVSPTMQHMLARHLDGQIMGNVYYKLTISYLSSSYALDCNCGDCVVSHILYTAHMTVMAPLLNLSPPHRQVVTVEKCAQDTRQIYPVVVGPDNPWRVSIGRPDPLATTCKRDVIRPFVHPQAPVYERTSVYLLEATFTTASVAATSDMLRDEPSLLTNGCSMHNGLHLLQNGEDDWLFLQHNGTSTQPPQDSGTGTEPLQDMCAFTQPLYDIGTSPQPLQDIGTGPQPLYDVGTGPQPLYDIGTGTEPLYGIGAGPQPLYDIGAFTQSLYDTATGTQPLYERNIVPHKVVSTASSAALLLQHYISAVISLWPKQLRMFRSSWEQRNRPSGVGGTALCFPWQSMLSSSYGSLCLVTEAPHLQVCDNPLRCCVPWYLLLGEPYSCSVWDPLNMQSTITLPWMPLLTHVHACYVWEAPSICDAALTICLPWQRLVRYLAVCPSSVRPRKHVMHAPSLWQKLSYVAASIGQVGHSLLHGSRSAWLLLHAVATGAMKSALVFLGDVASVLSPWHLWGCCMQLSRSVGRFLVSEQCFWVVVWLLMLDAMARCAVPAVLAGRGWRKWLRKVRSACKWYVGFTNQLSLPFRNWAQAALHQAVHASRQVCIYVRTALSLPQILPGLIAVASKRVEALIPSQAAVAAAGPQLADYVSKGLIAVVQTQCDDEWQVPFYQEFAGAALATFGVGDRLLLHPTGCWCACLNLGMVLFLGTGWRLGLSVALILLFHASALVGLQSFLWGAFARVPLSILLAVQSCNLLWPFVCMMQYMYHWEWAAFLGAWCVLHIMAGITLRQFISRYTSGYGLHVLDHFNKVAAAAGTWLGKFLASWRFLDQVLCVDAFYISATFCMALLGVLSPVFSHSQIMCVSILLMVPKGPLVPHKHYMLFSVTLFQLCSQVQPSWFAALPCLCYLLLHVVPDPPLSLVPVCLCIALAPYVTVAAVILWHLGLKVYWHIVCTLVDVYMAQDCCSTAKPLSRLTKYKTEAETPRLEAEKVELVASEAEDPAARLTEASTSAGQSAKHSGDAGAGSDAGAAAALESTKDSASAAKGQQQQQQGRVGASEAAKVSVAAASGLQSKASTNPSSSISKAAGNMSSSAASFPGKIRSSISTTSSNIVMSAARGVRAVADLAQAHVSRIWSSSWRGKCAHVNASGSASTAKGQQQQQQGKPRHHQQQQQQGRLGASGAAKGSGSAAFRLRAKPSTSPSSSSSKTEASTSQRLYKQISSSISTTSSNIFWSAARGVSAVADDMCARGSSIWSSLSWRDNSAQTSANATPAAAPAAPAAPAAAAAASHFKESTKGPIRSSRNRSSSSTSSDRGSKNTSISNIGKVIDSSGNASSSPAPPPLPPRQDSKATSSRISMVKVARPTAAAAYSATPAPSDSLRPAAAPTGPVKAAAKIPSQPHSSTSSQQPLRLVADAVVGGQSNTGSTTAVAADGLGSSQAPRGLAPLVPARRGSSQCKAQAAAMKPGVTGPGHDATALPAAAAAAALPGVSATSGSQRSAVAAVANGFGTSSTTTPMPKATGVFSYASLAAGRKKAGQGAAADTPVRMPAAAATASQANTITSSSSSSTNAGGNRTSSEAPPVVSNSYMISSSSLGLSINTTAASSTLPSPASCSTATTPRYSLSSPATSSTTSMLEQQSSSWPETASSSSSPTTVPHTMWSLLDQVRAEANKNHIQQQSKQQQQQQVVEGGEPSEAALGTDAAVVAVTGRRGRGRKRVGPICMVCEIAASNVLLRPCNHLVLCAGCSEIAETSGSDCPFCRTAVREYLKVHRS